MQYECDEKANLVKYDNQRLKKNSAPLVVFICQLGTISLLFHWDLRESCPNKTDATEVLLPPYFNVSWSPNAQERLNTKMTR